MQSIAVLHNRSNALGGGLADYNIYPQYKSRYALHVFYNGARAKQGCAAFSEKYVDLANLSRISTRQVKGIVEAPLSRRCFVQPLPHKPEDSRLDEKAFTPRCVVRINAQPDGAYIFSSGKNRGIFKAVGCPETVGTFYRMEE